MYNCLSYPCGIAVADDGETIYLCEMLKNRLLRIAFAKGRIPHVSVFKQFSGRVGPTSVILT